MPQIVVRYSEAEKIKAVATYIALGRLSSTAVETKIPYETLRHWKKQEWWKQYERMVKNEENAVLSSKFRKIASKVQDQILDRIEDGDHVVLRDGSVIRVPVKARELAVVGAIATDKILALDNTLEEKQEDMGIEQRLKLLAKELVDLASGKKKEPLTVDYEETKDGQTQETQDQQTQTQVLDSNA
jgi:transposase-like protein